MLNRLKEIICLKLGRDIRTRGDCELLSRQILLETGNYVNYNTLRRFFAIDKNLVKPRIQTLDIMSQYAGYKSYEHFVALKPQQQYFDQNLKTAEVLHSIDSNHIETHFATIRNHHNQAINFLIELIRDKLYRGKLTELCMVLDALSIQDDDFSYEEKLYIGNMIGLSLQRLQPPLRARSPLLGNRFFNNYVFEIFVDYAHLNHYYYQFVKYRPQSPQQKVFKHCLLLFKSYLNQTSVKVSPSILHMALTLELHPILKGRLISLELYVPDMSFEMLAHLKETLALEIWYEPMVVSIITADFRMMDTIDKVITNNFSSRTYSHNHYFQVFFTFKACYYYKTGQTKKAIYYLRQIDMNSFRLSYKVFLRFFIHLLKWRLENHQLSKQLAIELSKQFNYPRLDRAYIENY